MKSMIILVAALAAFVLVSPAVHAGEFGVSFSTQIRSKDVSYFGGLSLDEPVQESNLHISLPWWGFYVDFWHSMGLNDDDLSSDAGDEIDVTLGWAGKVKEWLSMGVGVTYADCTALLNKEGGDYVKPSLWASLPLKVAEDHELEPFVLLELVFPVSGSDAGIVVTGGAKHTWKIGSTAVICQKLGLRYYEVQNSPEYGCLVDYRFSLGWKVLHRLIKWEPLEHVTVNLPTIKAIFPLYNQHEANDKDPEAAIGAGFTIAFF